MLDFVPSTPEGVNSRVPMDMSQYLLSASPPSFALDFMSLSLQQSSQAATNENYQGLTMTVNHMACPFHHQLPSQGNYDRLRKQRSALKPIIMCSDSSDSECESTPESPQSPGRTPKKVSFADHKGLALAQVRFVKEGPDDPPQLDAKVLSLLTRGANAGISSSPPMKLCFPQPASDYMAFRDKVVNNFVSLENVILDEYTTKGTIKVKNIAFEKHVFVRVSLDDWSSFTDHDAVYIPGPGNRCNEPIDTFVFKLDISPSFDVAVPIQFAVCFEGNDNQYWDNNGGSNYRMVSDRYESNSRLPHTSVNPRWLPDKRGDESWTEFSAWRGTGTGGSAPYY